MTNVRNVLALALTGGLLTLAVVFPLSMGCSSTRIVTAQKEPSLALLKSMDVQVVRTFIEQAQATAIIAPPSSSGPTGYGFRDMSSAIPVSADGYYLTAAHCVEECNDLKIVSFPKNEDMVVSDARVVWIGENREPDLAIVHTTKPSLNYLQIDDASALPDEEVVLASGWGAMHGNESEKHSRSFSAGLVQSVSPLTEDVTGCRYRVITHSSPISPGDSGGPLLSTRGVLGVHSHGILERGFAWQRFRSSFGVSSEGLTGYKAVAYSPDPEWLNETIEKDRLRGNLETP